MLRAAQEYDRRNKDPEEPVRDLLVHFANINHALEAREYECLGAYAEAIVAEGRDKADLSFPDVVAHPRTCPDCRSALEATVASITESEETD